MTASRWATAAIGAITLLASCGGEEPSDLPSPQPPQSTPPAASPAPSLSPEDAAAAEEILASLDAYLEGLVELSKEGVPGGTDETMARLEELPVRGLAFLHLRDDILNANFHEGRATAGTLTWTAEVVEIDWEFSYPHNPDFVFPRAVLKVCLDETQWTTVDKETGQVVDGPGSRYLSVITTAWEDTSDGVPIEPGWYIVTHEDSTEPC